MKSSQTDPAAEAVYRTVLDSAGDAAGRASGSERRPRCTSWNPRRSALRWPTAAAVLVAGAAHVPPVPEHLSKAPYIGVLFIGLAVVCAGIAGLLVWRHTHGVWRLAAAVTSATALAYLASRTVGLPEIGDDVGNWSDPLGTIAMAAELATVALACVALRRDRYDTQSPPDFRASDTVRESTSTLGKDSNS
jgi:hypothetical protein